MKKTFLTSTTPIDRIILVLALIFVVWSYKHYWITPSQPADYALIWVTNQVPKQINLQHEQQITIQGSLGESLIEVKEGQIRFMTSPCHNKQCIHAGWLTNKGDFIACLPNQISIELPSIQNPQFDAIAY
jgi:hypothetical protein